MILFWIFLGLVLASVLVFPGPLLVAAKWGQEGLDCSRTDAR